MKIDRFTLMMTLLIVLVVVVVGASQYQQFALNENNNVKLNLINQALHNQTEDILHRLENHGNTTNMIMKLLLSNSSKILLIHHNPNQS